MPKKNQKTCWSIVINFFSSLTQRELILGYLFFSSGLLSQGASAGNVKEETYFTPGMKKVHPEPVEVCIHASPGCFINARSIFNENNKRAFEVAQLCSEDPDFNDHLNQLTLYDQMKHNRFYGKKICNEILENKEGCDDLIKQISLGDAEYQVSFEKEDRIGIKYSPR